MVFSGCHYRRNSRFVYGLIGWFLVFHATFNDISFISWRSVLLMEKKLSHEVVSSFLHLAMNGVRTHTFSGDMDELHRQLKIQLPYDDDHDGPLFIEETATFLLYMIYLPRRQLWDFSNSHYRMNLRYTLKLSFENKRLNILGLRFRIEITVYCVIDTLEL